MNDEHQDEYSLYNRMNQQIHNSAKFKPPTPKARKTYRCTIPEEKDSTLNICNNTYTYMDDTRMTREQKLNLSENDTSLKDDGINDEQITESSEHIEENEEDEKFSSFLSQDDTSFDDFKDKNSSQLSNYPSKQDTKTSEKINEQDTSKKISKQDIKINKFYIFAPIILSIIIGFFYYKIQTQSISNYKINTAHTISQFKSIKEIKAEFYNQESDIWNDILSAISETESRNPKIPQIILLFANETTTMNCLATALADVSTKILNTNNRLHLNPENLGNDAGEIIEELKKYSQVKSVVIISNILNINAEAIKALHNLCDKENPLIREVLYIFTMETNNNRLSQQRLKFVEDQFYHKWSKNIDRDTLGALVTRVTDAAIIPVQPNHI